MAIDPTTVIYSPTATYHEQVYVPTDLTESFSARYNAPIEAALDNAAWARGNAGVPPKIQLQAAANLGFTFGLGPDTARFVYVAGARYGWLQADTTDGGGLAWQIDVPATLNVTSVTAHLLGNDGGAGHGGALPQFVPTLVMIRQPLDGSAGTLLHSADDPSTGGTYDAYHTISIAGIEEQFAADQCIIGFSGEYGIGSVDECLKLIGIELTVGFVPL